MLLYLFAELLIYSKYVLCQLVLINIHCLVTLHIAAFPWTLLAVH